MPEKDVHFGLTRPVRFCPFLATPLPPLTADVLSGWSLIITTGSVPVHHLPVVFRNTENIDHRGERNSQIPNHMAQVYLLI